MLLEKTEDDYVSMDNQGRLVCPFSMCVHDTDHVHNIFFHCVYTKAKNVFMYGKSWKKTTWPCTSQLLTTAYQCCYWSITANDHPDEDLMQAKYCLPTVKTKPCFKLQILNLSTPYIFVECTFISSCCIRLVHVLANACWQIQGDDIHDAKLQWMTSAATANYQKLLWGFLYPMHLAFAQVFPGPGEDCHNSSTCTLHAGWTVTGPPASTISLRQIAGQ